MNTHSSGVDSRDDVDGFGKIDDVFPMSVDFGKFKLNGPKPMLSPTLDQRRISG